MKAGWLRHSVKVQSETRSVDAGGGVTKTWATVTDGERPAAITPVSSAEAFSAQQLQERVTHRIIIRYLAGITSGMRILFGTRAFEVKSVIVPREIQQQVVLLCEERQAT